MNSVEINRVLGQIHALRDQVSGNSSNTIILDKPPVDFGAVLKSAIDQVNGYQATANKLTDAFEAGEPGVNLSEVMIATQKASVSFQAATQVRNKLVDAYKDIMNMPM
jgi:flagellar hook-basal body complex protein FliE